MTPFVTIIAAIASGTICALLIVLLHPVLKRYALARPDARSSHATPTPQGGGVAVIGATIAATTGAALLGVADNIALLPVFAAAILLAVVGACDDLRPMPALPRLVLQTIGASLVLAALPADLRIAPFAPFWIERAALLVGGLWFINLVNFMDGLDWMTVAEMVPITAALVLFGLAGHLPPGSLLVAAALGGAIIGFAPFNKPVARLFLGDVGSLPIGLLVAWCLLLLAAGGHLAAAVLLPLYYLADATLTLGRRLAKGETVWQAHRTHFYQRATDNGYSVMQIVATVFLLNVCLAALAGCTVAFKSLRVDVAALAMGGCGVAWVLRRFSRPKQVV